jgi:hypothetical protein
MQHKSPKTIQIAPKENFKKPVQVVENIFYKLGKKLGKKMIFTSKQRLREWVVFLDLGCGLCFFGFCLFKLFNSLGLSILHSFFPFYNKSFVRKIILPITKVNRRMGSLLCPP